MSFESGTTNYGGKPTRISGRCDICWRKDKGSADDARMILQRCCKCGVCVHNECYGLQTTNNRGKRDPNFVCHACQAVGKTIKVRKRNPKTGKRLQFEVTKRPTECCLCGVDDKHFHYHAMHPVYDYHGPRGRQMVLEASEKKPARLAWAHSLCAFSICSYRTTAGCVYGCTKGGMFAGCDEDGDDDEQDCDESVNSDLEVDEHSQSDTSIHHFVYVLPPEQRTSNPIKLRGRSAIYDGDAWVKAIREHQENLMCYICGKSDKSEKIRRIAIQCSAGDECEFEEFRKCHSDLRSGDECYQAMHFGCAVWGKNDQGEYSHTRRFYYFPGLESTNSDKFRKTVVNCFCDAHALDIRKKKKQGCTILNYPINARVEALPDAKLQRQEQTRSNSVPTQQQRQPYSQIQKRGKRLTQKPSTEIAAAPRPSTSQKRPSTIMSTGTATQRSRHNTLTKHAGTINTPVTITKRQKRSSLALITSGHQAEATSIIKHHGSRLLGSKNIDTTSPQNSLCDEMVEDVVKAFRSKQIDPNDSKQGNVLVWNSRERFWKRKANLSSEAFKDLWPNVQEKVRQIIAISANNSISAASSSGSKSEPPTSFQASNSASRASIKSHSCLSDETPALDDVGDDADRSAPVVAQSDVSKAGASSVASSLFVTAESDLGDRDDKTKGKDWSFLVVGKNYNPNKLNLDHWDTYEEIPSVRNLI